MHYLEGDWNMTRPTASLHPLLDVPGRGSFLSVLLLMLYLPLGTVQAQTGSWQQNQSIGGFNQVHVYTPARTRTRTST